MDGDGESKQKSKCEYFIGNAAKYKNMNDNIDYYQHYVMLLCYFFYSRLFDKTYDVTVIDKHHLIYELLMPFGYLNLFSWPFCSLACV